MSLFCRGVSIQVLQIDDVALKVSALKAIFDQLVTFGIEPFTTKKAKATEGEGAEISTGDEPESKAAEEVTATAKSVLKLLSDFLDSEVRNGLSPVTLKSHVQRVRLHSYISFLGSSLNLANILKFYLFNILIKFHFHFQYT